MIPRLAARLRAWLHTARKVFRHAWRLITGRASLHLVDPDGEARLTINARRGQ